MALLRVVVKDVVSMLHYQLKYPYGGEKGEGSGNRGRGAEIETSRLRMAEVKRKERPEIAKDRLLLLCSVEEKGEKQKKSGITHEAESMSL